MDKPNIVLIGMMGTSKTTSGQIVATQLGLDFVDTDSVITKQSGCTIEQLFNVGEQHFRQIESTVIAEVSRLKNVVISCGGGVALNESNMINLQAGAVIIHLTASANEIFSRVSSDQSRPLLSGGSALEKIVQLKAARHEAYLKFANFTIDNTFLSAQQCADKIVELINL